MPKDDTVYIGHMLDMCAKTAAKIAGKSRTEFPDYLTQGESFEDLKDHLGDLYLELNSGNILAVRRTAVLDLARSRPWAAR